MNDVSDKLGQALALLNANALTEALAVVRPLAEAHPDDPNAQFVLGETLRRAGDSLAALQALRHAVRLAPNDANIAYRAGLAAAQAGDMPGAVVFHQAAVARNGDFADGWFQLGLAHSHQNALADAALAFAEVTRLAPAVKAAWRNLGIVLIGLGRNDEAEAAFRGALAQDTDDVASLSNLASVLQAQGRIEGALTSLARALSLSPDRRDLLEIMVNLLRQEHRSAEAEVVLRQAIERTPQDAPLINLRAMVLRELGRVAEAVAEHERALAIDPGDAGIYTGQGYALRRAERRDESEAAFRKAIALDGLLEDAHVGLASLLFDAGRLQEAQDTLDDYDKLRGAPSLPKRSAVIAVLDYSPGSPYNIATLLDDLKDFDGEVICVFNGDGPYRDLAAHPRIDKFSYNKHNVGVSRGWNIGINQAEGETIFILNADLKLSLPALDAMERYLQTLPDALAVGVAGDWLDPQTGKIATVLVEGSFTEPTQVDQVSGHLFALHANRLHDAGIFFDPRLAPYLYEEGDLAIKAKAAGLKLWACPVKGYEHQWGISRRDRRIHFFGRPVNRVRCMIANSLLLERKTLAAKGRVGRG